MCITEYDEAKTMEMFKEEGIAEGMAKGKIEGKLEDLINIIKALDLSLDKAMEVLGIAANEKEKYATLVKSAMQS